MHPQGSCNDYNLTDLYHKDENGCTMTINMLPDDVLLEIFDQCRQDPDRNWFFVWGPNGLVHDGDGSYLDHRAVLISNFLALTELL
jgi:hypothetical protein